jgi:hypothetical protein
MTPQNDGLHNIWRPYKEHSSFFPEMTKNRLNDPSLNLAVQGELSGFESVFT